jgi:hypothetical protein
MRKLLWALLVVCAVGNTVISLRSAPLALHVAFGVVTLACLVALVSGYVRGGTR